MRSMAVLLPAGALLLLATPIHASTLPSSLSATFAPLSTTDTYYAPANGVNVGLGSFSQDVTGNVALVRTSPFGDDTTPYDSVGANADVFFGTRPVAEDLSRLAYASGPASNSFASGDNSFQFVWGTPDVYNVLTFYDNGTNVGSFSLSPLNSPVPLSSGAYIATVTGMGAFNGVEFQSVGANAFEFAGVSPVPLPGALPMFGGAVLAMSILGVIKRRKGTVAQA